MDKETIALLGATASILISFVALVNNWSKNTFDKRLARRTLAIHLEKEAVGFSIKISKLKKDVARAELLREHLSVQELNQLGINTKYDQNRQVDALLDLMELEPDFFEEMTLLSASEIKQFALSFNRNQELLENIFALLQTYDRLAYLILRKQIKEKDVGASSLKYMKSALENYSAYIDLFDPESSYSAQDYFQHLHKYAAL